MCGKLHEHDMCAVLLGSRWCCLGSGRLWCVPGQGDRWDVFWVSGWRASPSGRPGSLTMPVSSPIWVSWGGMRRLHSIIGKC